VTAKDKPVPALDGRKKSKKAFCERGGMKVEIYFNQFCTGPNEWKARIQCTGWADCIYYHKNGCPYYHDPGPPAFDSFGGWV